MQINVSQLLKEPIGSARNYEVNEVIDIAGDGRDSLVQGEVELIHTNRGVLVKGALRTEVEVNCNRCLTPFNCPLTLNIEEEYFPTTDIASGVPLPLPEDTSSFTIDEHHILDLTEAIRQYALLAIPMKLLCCEDCAGLCPSCGHNLNQGPCSCLPNEIDHRWDKLSKLAPTRDTIINQQKGT